MIVFIFMPIVKNQISYKFWLFLHLKIIWVSYKLENIWNNLATVSLNVWQQHETEKYTTHERVVALACPQMSAARWKSRNSPAFPPPLSRQWRFPWCFRGSWIAPGCSRAQLRHHIEIAVDSTANDRHHCVKSLVSWMVCYVALNKYKRE